MSVLKHQLLRECISLEHVSNEENGILLSIYIYKYVMFSIKLTANLNGSLKNKEKNHERCKIVHPRSVYFFPFYIFHGFCLKIHSVVNQTHRDYVLCDMNACWLPKEIMSYFLDCTILWNSLNCSSNWHTNWDTPISITWFSWPPIGDNTTEVNFRIR
jgi:hypothetical protein